MDDRHRRLTGATPPRLDPGHPDVLVLVGTQTGNTELVADAVAVRLGESGYTCHILDMADAFPEMLVEYRQAVIALCTWAEGTYPDNALDFATALDRLAPALSELTFAIVGLGDRAYEPFYQTAAQRLSDRLESLGARRAVSPLEVDGPVTAGVLNAARDWAASLAGELASQA